MSKLYVNEIYPQSGDWVAVSGNLDVSGTLTAYEFNTIVQSETTYLGSNSFGNDGTDVHAFTGSLEITGSGVTFTGAEAGAVTLTLKADQGDDSESVTLTAADGGAFTIDSTTATVTVDGHTGVTLQSTNSGDILLDSVADIVLDAAGGNVEFKDAGTTQLLVDMDTTAGEIRVELEVDGDDLAFYQYDGTEVLRLDDDGDVKVFDDLRLTSDSSVFAMGAGNDFTITHDGTTGATLAGNPVHITAGGNSTWKATAGTLLIDSEASAVTVDGHAGVTITSSNSGEVDITSAANVDINATTGVTIDGTTISIDGTDDVNLTVTSSTAGEDLTISQVGANDSSVIITAAGTGTDAVSIDVTAGSMLIAPSLIDGKTLTIGPSSATQMVFTPHGTAASEKISLTNTAGTADDAISIVSTAGGVKVQAGNDSLHLDADGTDADALNIDSAGGIDVDAAGAISLDSSAGSIDINVVDGQTVKVGLNGAVETIWTPHATAGSELWSTTNTAGTAANAVALTATAGGVTISAGNTTHGVKIGDVSGAPVTIGHTTSETTVSDNLTVTGDLTVNGTTTTINSTTLTVDDLNIVLASGAADSAAADGAGITVDGAAATILYEHTGTKWMLNKPLDMTANAITTTGTVTAGDLAVDNFTLNGTELDLSSGNMTIDAAAGTVTVDGHTGVNIESSNSGEVDITSAAAVDINATTTVTIDGAGVSIDSAGVAANFTVATDGAGEDLTIGLTGATDSSIVISSTGTGADAINIDTTAGSIDIDSADNITIDAADDISISTTSTDGAIVITSAFGSAGEAFHLDANAHAGAIVNIDAGILDIDATGAVTLDSSAAGVSIDGVTASNFTVTGAGEDLTISVAGGGDQVLELASAGTGTDAIHVNASAGGIDIDSADMIDIDAADEITITTTSADGHISLVSAHTAGVAFHIDANANAGSIVDIDAGILDIDVTGASTLNTTVLEIAATTEILAVTPELGVENGAASSATAGGKLQLICDDGAVMASGHRLGVIEFAGAEDASNNTTVGARIEALCDATWSASENGASLLFYTTDGNASQSEVLKLDSNKLATFSGAAQFNSTVTAGIDDTGVDVRFYSATASEGILYDASEDELALLLTTKLKFHDVGGGEEIFASANGHLEINAGTTLDVTAPTIELYASSEVYASTTEFVIENTTASSATQGGKLYLMCDDGAAMASGHRLGVIEFAGAEDASNTDTVGARIEAITDATWSASENGTELHFYTTDGNATQTARMKILAEGDVEIPGGMLEVASGIEITTKTAIIKASESVTSAGTVTQNLRAGKITLDMGHTWANDSSFEFTLSNTTIDVDSVVLVTSGCPNVAFDVMSLADNSCLISGFNETGSGITADFVVNYVVL